MNSLIKKIIVTIVVVVVSIVAILLLSLKPTKTNGDGEGFGQITLIIEEEQVLYNQKLDFAENENLLDLLNNNFSVGLENFSFGVFILSIKGDNFEVVTDGSSAYLAIYIIEDGVEVVSLYGASDIYLVDEMIILIRVISL